MLAFLSSHLIWVSDTEVCHFLQIQRNHAKDVTGLRHSMEAHPSCTARAIAPTGEVLWSHAINVLGSEIAGKGTSGLKLILPLLKKADQGEVTSFLKSKSINFNN
jgi:hypothetical protein